MSWKHKTQPNRKARRAFTKALRAMSKTQDTTRIRFYERKVRHAGQAR